MRECGCLIHSRCLAHFFSSISIFSWVILVHDAAVSSLFHRTYSRVFIQCGYAWAIWHQCSFFSVWAFENRITYHFVVSSCRFMLLLLLITDGDDDFFHSYHFSFNVMPHTFCSHLFSSMPSVRSHALFICSFIACDSLIPFIDIKNHFSR